MIIGLVGKPSAGKSTFFRASTLAEAEVANYPFTTIKPNHGIGYVKVEDLAKQFSKTSDPRMGYVLNGYRFVPVDLMDVAGLVPGAHEGQGMGNQFLDNLREADALLHIVDVSGSTNEKGEPVDAGTYDPANDLRWLCEELDLWYLSIIRKGWEKFARQLQQEKKPIQQALAKQLSGLNVGEDRIADAIKQLGFATDQPTSWSEEELFSLARALRKASKPMITVCNKADVSGAKAKFEALKQAYPDEVLIPASAESELALREAAKHDLIDYVPGSSSFTIKEGANLSEKQQMALTFIQKNMLDVFGSTGVQQALDTAVFDLLDYIAIYPGGANKLEDKEGNCLPDCFLLKKGSTALDFAYKLHTDFGKNFIKAIDVKTKRTVGKEHELKNGDILEIVV